MPRIRITEGSKPVKIKWKDKDSDPDWKSKITESGWTPPSRLECRQGHRRSR